jgi:chaperonin cofactor prefoldin
MSPHSKLRQILRQIKYIEEQFRMLEQLMEEFQLLADDEAVIVE